MFKNRYLTIVYIAILLTLLLRIIPLVFPDSRLWGINHLIFLPDFYSVSYYGLILLAIVISFSKKAQLIGDKIATQFNSSFIEGNKAIYYKASFIILSMALFIVLAMPTHFLGDGYTILSYLSSEEFQFYKWSEPGSYFALKSVQSILGPTNGDTAI